MIMILRDEEDLQLVMSMQIVLQPRARSSILSWGACCLMLVGVVECDNDDVYWLHLAVLGWLGHGIQWWCTMYLVSQYFWPFFSLTFLCSVKWWLLGTLLVEVQFSVIGSPFLWFPRMLSGPQMMATTRGALRLQTWAEGHQLCGPPNDGNNL